MYAGGEQPHLATGAKNVLSDSVYVNGYLPIAPYVSYATNLNYN